MKLISVCYDPESSVYMGFEKDGSMWQCQVNEDGFYEWVPVPMADSIELKVQNESDAP